MTTECINGHRFATTSTAGSCRNDCKWTWAENDGWGGEEWKFDPIYQYDFDPTYFKNPPLCPMANESSLAFYTQHGKNGTEKHMAYGKEWHWLVGDYEEPVEDIEVKKNE